MAIIRIRSGVGGELEAGRPCVLAIETYSSSDLDRRRLLYVVQGASIRGRLPPSATLAHKVELDKMPRNEADREVHGFRCKLATCRWQELHGPRKQPLTPHAWTK